MAIKNGDRIVRVGQEIPLTWTSQDVDYINIYLTTNPDSFDGTHQSSIIEDKPNLQGENKHMWTVSDSDHQLSLQSQVYLVVSMVGSKSFKVLDASQAFWVLEKSE